MYLEQLNMLAQLWSQNVKTNQAGPYRELMEHLLELAHEIFLLLAQANAKAVLDSVEDSSGRSLAGEHGFTLQITKEDSIIRRKRWTKVERTEEVKVGLGDYYQVTCSLGDTQGKFMNTPKGKAAKDTLSAYYEAAEDLANDHGSYMEKMWQLQMQCSNQNTFLNVMNHVYIPYIQVTVMSRHQEETAEGRTFQQLATSRHTPNHEKLLASCSGSTRTLAALAHFILFRQVSGQPTPVADCARDFKCDTTMLEQLTTGKADRDK